jgi:LytS/YehU family sensor histidine kinase
MLGFAFVPGIIVFYACYSMLFGKYLASRKILKFILSVFCVAIPSVILGELIMYFLTGPMVSWTTGTMISMGFVMLLNALLNGAIAIGMKSVIHWYGDIRLKEDLKQKNYEMELALVKAQLNPHFLFNTINNIDVLIMQDAQKASQYLNQLSDMMRFMLYETKTQLVTLENELSYIEKYISLQRIRTNNPDYIHYSRKGDTANHKIAPMLFIPFIENAFKHSVQRKEQNVIDIQFMIDEDHIEFTCRNNYILQRPSEEGYNGLGNELIEKRLQLLFKKKYSLQINDAENWYTVHLKIPT